jgi:hypothetical protein
MHQRVLIDVIFSASTLSEQSVFRLCLHNHNWEPSWIGLRTGILWGSELLLCAGEEVQIHATREMHCFLEQRLCKNKRSAAKCWQNLLQQEPLKRTEVPNVCCDTCYRGRDLLVNARPSTRVNSGFSPCLWLSVVLLEQLYRFCNWQWAVVKFYNTVRSCDGVQVFVQFSYEFECHLSLG